MKYIKRGKHFEANKGKIVALNKKQFSDLTQNVKSKSKVDIDEMSWDSFEGIGNLPEFTNNHKEKTK